MTPSYTVRTTPRFDRLLKAPTRRHAELVNDYAEALSILLARTSVHASSVNF